MPARAQDAAKAAADANVRRFELRVENGRLTNGWKTIQAQREDAVEIIWSTDRETSLHLHAYDIDLAVDPGQPQTMKFVARAAGRFPVHDKNHKLLLYLEVLPR